MATYYFVSGTNPFTWDIMNTENWSEESGGAGGAGPPGATDDVIFDANSSTAGVSTVVLDGDVEVGWFDASDLAGSVSIEFWSNRLQVNGDVTLSSYFKKHSSGDEWTAGDLIVNGDLYTNGVCGSTSAGTADAYICTYLHFGTTAGMGINPEVFTLTTDGYNRIFTNINAFGSITVNGNLVTDSLYVSNDDASGKGQAVGECGIALGTGTHKFTAQFYVEQTQDGSIDINLGSAFIEATEFYISENPIPSEDLYVYSKPGASTVSLVNNAKGAGWGLDYNSLYVTLASNDIGFFGQTNIHENTITNLYLRPYGSASDTGTVSFVSGNTVNVTNLYCDGNSLSRSDGITIQSGDSGTAWYLNAASGTIEPTNTYVSDNTAQGGATFYGGISVVDDGGNTGWTFDRNNLLNKNEGPKGYMGKFNTTPQDAEQATSVKGQILDVKVKAVV